MVVDYDVVQPNISTRGAAVLTNTLQGSGGGYIMGLMHGQASLVRASSAFGAVSSVG